MSKTNIHPKTSILLWTKSGGRCQYRGCNQPLYLDLLSKKNYNRAYIAHIVADSADGPRGDAIKSPLLADKIENLMLLCDACHRRVDRDEVEMHTVSLLTEMKKEHEARIASATAIQPANKTHLIVYRANVGMHTPEISFETVSPFIFPDYFPAESSVIDLSRRNSLSKDSEMDFWKNEEENLVNHFNYKVKNPLLQDQIKHFSIFALAPIPVLVKLGTLINDIYPATIFQPQREPKTWKLSDQKIDIKYEVIKPPEIRKSVALNISLSGTISNDRIEKILGQDVSIYTLTIEKPFNDFLKSKSQLSSFSQTVRLLFDEIKFNCGDAIPIHVFPAMPVATAIELGRVWMPKVDLPLIIYDQNSTLCGFARAIEISNT